MTGAPIIHLYPTADSRPAPSTFDWCSRDNGAPVGRRCLDCRAVHLCRTGARNCLACRFCGSDRWETA